jgi:hypothetical protein
MPMKNDSSKLTKIEYFIVRNFNDDSASDRSIGGRDRYPATTNYRFGLVDRQTGQTYQTEFLSGAYGKGARYYVKHLEKFRKANAK